MDKIPCRDQRKYAAVGCEDSIERIREERLEYLPKHQHDAVNVVCSEKDPAETNKLKRQKDRQRFKKFVIIGIGSKNEGPDLVDHQPDTVQSAPDNEA
jgi:hypothetical protein